MRFKGERVDRLPYLEGATDSRGNPVVDWGEPEPVENVAFDPGSTFEPREPGGNRVVVEPSLYARRPDLPFQHRDRVIARGLTYEVEGEVRRWRSPYTGRYVGSVVTLRRVSNG